MWKNMKLWNLTLWLHVYTLHIQNKMQSRTLKKKEREGRADIHIKVEQTSFFTISKQSAKQKGKVIF